MQEVGWMIDRGFREFEESGLAIHGDASVPTRARIVPTSLDGCGGCEQAFAERPAAGSRGALGPWSGPDSTLCRRP
jgi:hypothetical protein